MMSDVIGVLDETHGHGRVHLEFVARGISENGPEQPRVAGIRRIAKALATCRPLGMTSSEGDAVHVFAEDGAVTFSLSLGLVSVDVVIRAEIETLDESANWTVVS